MQPTDASFPTRFSSLKSTARIVVVVAAWVAWAVCVFSLWGRYSFFAELLSNFRFQLMLAVLPFPPVLFLMRFWKTGLLMTATAAWAILGIAQLHVSANPVIAGDLKIRIMSFNVYTANDDAEQVLLRISQSNPDIVAVIEYTHDWATGLRPLHAVYPHRFEVPRPHGFGVALFSKYRLENAHNIQICSESGDTPLISADAVIAKQRVRMICAHLMSPIDRSRMKLRNRQFDELAAVVNQESTPTVVMGDFNCTPWSHYMHKFIRKTGLRDTTRGFGFQPTWPSDYGALGLPIDHAFVSPEIYVHERTVLPAAGSDHLPLLFSISLPPATDSS